MGKSVRESLNLGVRTNPTFGARNELDPRQKKLVNYYLDPKSLTFMNKGASAKAAGYNYRNPAEALAPKRMAKSVRRAIEEVMGKAGLTEDLLIRRHKELLMRQEARYNPKTLQFEETDKPDPVAVPKALDMAYKLRGDYAPDRSIVGHIDLTAILEEIQSDERPIVRNKIEVRRQGVAAEQPLLDNGQAGEQGKVPDEQVPEGAVR